MRDQRRAEGSRGVPGGCHWMRDQRKAEGWRGSRGQGVGSEETVHVRVLQRPEGD